MRIAIQEAIKGSGFVNPNPLVGAVIVNDEKIISTGYHKKYGENHAEINAFENAENEVEGATMYVTLEPCSHYGKTPPCVDKIIEKKIKRVVIGMLDPNPLVSGNGINKLMNAGIEVECGVLEEECKKINEVFIKYITKKNPFVLLKNAMSLDGKIATKYGESKWITGEKSRVYVHELRNEFKGIMVGINTILTDDPMLNCRLDNGRNPIKIIVDSSLRIPLEAKVLINEPEKTIIATTEKSDINKINKIENLGAKVISVPDYFGKVNLNLLMEKLGELKIDGILLEGGGTLNFSALESGIVDKVITFISTKIIGGKDSITPVEGSGIERLSQAFMLKETQMKSLGGDIVIEGYIGGNALCLQE